MQKFREKSKTFQKKMKIIKKENFYRIFKNKCKILAKKLKKLHQKD